MRSKSLLLVVLLLFTLAAGARQTQAQTSVMVALPQGGFVSFINRSEWIDLRPASGVRQLPGALGSQAMSGSDQTIHRILRDREGRVVFGYDLWILGDRTTRQFRIAIKPLDARLEESLRPAGAPAVEAISTFSKSTESQTLSDGSEFSVDLLINKNAGVKFIDVMKVSFDRSVFGDYRSARGARDFSADVVSMEMKDYSLLVNDRLFTAGKTKLGASGAVLWLYLPQRGRFIFSLVPRSDYPFEKAGFISGNKIEFSIHGEYFEWLSSAPILHEEGVWNLWVLWDPTYVPLMGNSTAPPPQKKLDDKIWQLKTPGVQTSVLQKSPVEVPTPTGLPPILERGEKNRVPDKVMFGAADRIENLLPRN